MLLELPLVRIRTGLSADSSGTDGSFGECVVSSMFNSDSSNSGSDEDKGDNFRDRAELGDFELVMLALCGPQGMQWVCVRASRARQWERSFMFSVGP